MSWIRVVDEEEAKGELQQIYGEIAKKRGKISNIMKIQSLNPDAMKKHMDFYLSIMFGHSGLSREERELIAIVASIINRCEYCINHHAETLKHYWKDEKLINKLIGDYRSVKISNKKQKMLEYVVKLTKNPYDIKKSDIDVLGSSGFSDSDILDINLITSYFSFVNRIVLGLGVQFSSDEIAGYKY